MGGGGHGRWSRVARRVARRYHTISTYLPTLSLREGLVARTSSTRLGVWEFRRENSAPRKQKKKKNFAGRNGRPTSKVRADSLWYHRVPYMISSQFDGYNCVFPPHVHIITHHLININKLQQEVVVNKLHQDNKSTINNHHTS